MFQKLKFIFAFILCFSTKDIQLFAKSRLNISNPISIENRIDTTISIKSNPQKKTDNYFAFGLTIDALNLMFYKMPYVTIEFGRQKNNGLSLLFMGSKNISGQTSFMDKSVRASSFGIGLKQYFACKSDGGFYVSPQIHVVKYPVTYFSFVNSYYRSYSVDEVGYAYCLNLGYCVYSGRHLVANIELGVGVISIEGLENKLWIKNGFEIGFGF